MRLKKDEVKLTVDAVILAEKSKYGIDLPARNDKWEVIQGHAKNYIKELLHQILQKPLRLTKRWVGWREEIEGR